MTVSTTVSKISYVASAAQTTFAYTFKIFADGDLKVYVNSTQKTLTTDYTVTGAGDVGGGNVIFGTGLSASDSVVIERVLDLTQGVDYIENDAFPAETHEDALDRLTFVTQQHQDTLDRTVKFATIVTDAGDVEVLGSVSARANKLFAFDSAGDLDITQEIGVYKGTDATTTTAAYIQRDLVKSTTTAQLNNVYICTAASAIGTLLTNTSYWALVVDAVSSSSSATAAAASAAAALVSENNAQSSEDDAAADLVLTNADVVTTNADVVLTHADVVLTNADVVSAEADKVQTGLDRVATAADKVATNADVVLTAADVVSSAASASTATTQATNASTSATNAATSATTATTQASAASTSATSAATQATTATTQATAAAASATAAAASADTFDDTYLGAKASDPTLDNDGDALTAGDMYFNTTTDIMKVYDGAAWGNVSVSASTVVSKSSSTGEADIPAGTTAQRGSGAAGQFRYNSTTASFEGYGSAWGSIGGGATGAGGDAVFVENELIVTTDYELSTNKSAMSVGPVTVNSGVSVTIPSGHTWVVL